MHGPPAWAPAWGRRAHETAWQRTWYRAHDARVRNLPAYAYTRYRPYTNSTTYTNYATYPAYPYTNYVPAQAYVSSYAPAYAYSYNNYAQAYPSYGYSGYSYPAYTYPAYTTAASNSTFNALTSALALAAVSGLTSNGSSNGLGQVLDLASTYALTASGLTGPSYLPGNYATPYTSPVNEVAPVSYASPFTYTAPVSYTSPFAYTPDPCATTGLARISGYEVDALNGGAFTLQSGPGDLTVRTDGACVTHAIGRPGEHVTVYGRMLNDSTIEASRIDG